MFLLRKRAEEVERDWLDKIEAWAVARDDCLWIRRVEPYRSCRVAGVVRRVRVDPQARVIRTTITDGSSSLSAQWALHFPVAQLRASPGEGLILEGVPTFDGAGELVLLEPSYEIVTGPAR